MELIHIAFIICVLCASAQAQLTVAVVEQGVVLTDNATTTIETNIQQYEQRIVEAKNKAKMVVFPEYGLTGRRLDRVADYAQFLPNSLVPVASYDYIVRRLANLAIGHGVYLAVNLLERDNATGTNVYYNTLAVFGPDGKIAATARKTNLDDDESRVLSRGSGVETVAIENQLFALLNNEDLLTNGAFGLDAQVTGVIVAARWRNTLPYNLATSLAAGYQRATNRTVYVANLNDPERGYSGTGAYSAASLRRATYITGKQSTSVEVYNPKGGRGFPGEDALAGLKYGSSAASILESKRPDNNTQTSKSVRCSLVYSVGDAADIAGNYTFVVMEGKEKVGGVEYRTTFCGLVPRLAGGRVKTEQVFGDIRIEATLPQRNTTLVLPVTADYDFLPHEETAFYRQANTSTLVGKNVYNTVAFGLKFMDAGAGSVQISALAAILTVLVALFHI